MIASKRCHPLDYLTHGEKKIKIYFVYCSFFVYPFMLVSLTEKIYKSIKNLN